MKTLRRFANRLAGAFSGSRRERDMAREMEAHIEMQAADNVRLGMTPEDAHRAAVLKFGGIESAKESYRDQRGLPVLDVLRQDLRYALRQLRKAPGFTAVAVLTLALGIGANTAIFSVMNVALFRGLPVHDPHQLVFLNTTVSFGAQSGDGDTSLTEYIFEQLRTQRSVFSDVVAFAPISNQKVSVRYGQEPEEALVDEVSGNFFSGLGVSAALGRTFLLDDEWNHSPIAVLSYAYWVQRCGGDAGVLGRPVFVKGIPFTVIGVTARNFIGVENRRPTDLWIPLQNRAEIQPWGQPPGEGLTLYGSAHNWWCLKMIGRLQPRVSQAAAIVQLQPVFQRAALEGAKRDPKFEKPNLYFKPARGIDGLRDGYEQPLQVLMAMAGVVLLIACANIAMLLIARNSARGREYSLRMALGGDRSRLFRQLLTESLLLVSVGAALAWFFAVWASQALARWAQLDLKFSPDWTVGIFTGVLALLVALVFGLAPLRSVVRSPLGLALRTTAATANQDRGRLRSGRVVVTLQIALCLVLLASAGFLIETLRNLHNVNLGLRASGLLVFGVSPQNLHSDAEALRFYEALMDRLRGVPGVESATLMRQRIGSGWTANSSLLVDGADPAGDGNSHVRWNSVGPDYFHVLRTPILLGRDFNTGDTSTSPRVAIVNETFAKKYLAGRDPLGHQIARGGVDAAVIAGVVADSKYSGVQEDSMPMAWFPYTQQHGIAGMHVELRTSAEPTSLLPQVRRTMQQFAPDLALLQPMTQQQQFDRSLSSERLLARLGIFFGMLAVLLAAIGLYGTLAYTVNRRTVEVGIRMALGARRGQVLWMVLRGSLIISAIGLAIGLPLAIAGARFLESMLFGVEPNDPRFFVAAAIGIALVALAASFIPARRAASVDPIVALRFE